MKKYVNNAWIYRFKSNGYDPRPDDPYVTANSEGGYDMAGYFPQATTKLPIRNNISLLKLKVKNTPLNNIKGCFFKKCLDYQTLIKP